MFNSLDLTNKSALAFSIDHIDLVQKQVAPLKDLFNLTSISYSKAFDDGSYMILVNLHGLTPVVSYRPCGLVQAPLALNLLYPEARCTFL